MASANFYHELNFLSSIADAPRFTTRPTNIAANKGDSVTLVCQVDANPKPIYTWNKIIFGPSGAEDKIKVGGNVQNLTVIASQETSGRYECIAAVPGSEAITARASVFLRGPPKILTDAREQTAPLDGLGRVNCEALSVPPVDRVEWFFRDRPIFSGIFGEGMHYSVIENRTQDGVVSTLVIAKVSTLDFGDYHCRVSNSLGSDVTVIKLAKERELTFYILQKFFTPF